MTALFPRRTLRLFEVREPEPRAQDLLSCAQQFTEPDGDAPSLSELMARFANENQDEQVVVPESDRPRAALQSVPDFWNEWVLPIRQRETSRKKLAKGTLDKERQVVQQFREWEAMQEPPWWRRETVARWPGASLSALTCAYLTKFVTAQLRRCKPATVQPRWFQLRTVLNFATKMKAVATVPSIDWQKALDDSGRIGEEDDEELFATSYSESQLVAVYQSLPTVQHQVAWVLGANAGPRTEDLYGLAFEQNLRLDQEPPVLVYKAQKTGKRHWVPLAPVTVRQLRRLSAGKLFAQGPLFPDLTGHNCKDPGRSRPARERTTVLKAALRGNGIQPVGDYLKPIQVLRATCNSRMKNHRPGVGHLLTHGPDFNDVNEAFYDDAKPRIIEAVMTLPQPAAFVV